MAHLWNWRPKLEELFGAGGVCQPGFWDSVPSPGSMFGSCALPFDDMGGGLRPPGFRGEAVAQTVLEEDGSFPPLDEATNGGEAAPGEGEETEAGDAEEEETEVGDAEEEDVERGRC